MLLRRSDEVAPSQRAVEEWLAAGRPGQMVLGNTIEYREDEDAWYYAADRAPVDGTALRPCPRCEQSVTPEGHDPCLGTLPNVRAACCGHGVAFYAYAAFEDGDVVREYDALDLFARLGVGPKESA